MSPGAARPASSSLVGALIAEGDPAVEPLLAALESDMRLTRSVTNGRGMSVERFLHPVREAVMGALVGILKTNEFGYPSFNPRLDDPAARKELARSMRAFWEKNRAVPLIERWYNTLRDDKAGQSPWVVAAAGLAQASDEAALPQANFNIRVSRIVRPGSKAMKGEPLRPRRDPSVSDLIARRTLSIAAGSNPLQRPDIGLHDACRMAKILHTWDADASLPVLRTLMARCLAGIEEGRDHDAQPDQGVAGYLADFALVLARSGDLEALDEYAGWLRRTTPKELEHQSIACFEPIWAFPGHTPTAEAARRLFADPGSPWVTLLHDPQNRAVTFFHDSILYTSPLLCVAPFRDALIAALADRAEIGTIRRGEPGLASYTLKSGGSGSLYVDVPDADVIAPGVEVPYRVCDEVARHVSALEGTPTFGLIWPEARRDRALGEFSAYLKRFGDRFSPDAPPGENDFPGPKAHLKFPPLGRVPTPDDVRQERAIFSLEGQGEARLVPVPAFPIKAKWTTLKDFPFDQRLGDGSVRREYDRDGWVWQAEEIRKGERWERSYGFVGHHVIARVPASEIELVADPYRWTPLPGGLDAQGEAVGPPATPGEPGRPVVAAIRLRNRLGVDRPSPTDFLRAGADGKPALRRGVTLKVTYTAPGIPGSARFQQRPAEPLKPSRDASFVPGDAARSLAPLESFEAFRVDLNDWFDLARPGYYHATVTFAADSGVGEGASDLCSFAIGDVDSLP